MAGDYTRFSFKPHKDFSGVLKQQGRVDLDADFNELIEIVDRRWRSETIDIIGHCIVPNTTPDAFLVIPTTMGAFDIGIGRMYVDGIQVENHGLPPLAYLADLAELNGTSATPYSDQPYLPAPLPPTLAAAPNTTDLVYIDVWEREVTVLEDPSIREIALGGPDTTTRMQSAWQVRVLENVGQHGCDDDIPAWNQLIAPSAGRLTTSAVAPPASDDPCIISPSGGYRGLENRLYRVEIHSTGPIGGGAPAKFKWSRNNATIASSVSAIPSVTEIVVQQIGRDQVLRFRIGDWIEVSDDYREFQGLAGHMAQITGIDEANRVITFSPAIPGTINFNAADPTRHTRLRRWDQSQNVDANGLMDVTAGPIDIEDGIRVSFSLNPAGGNFRVGDYWVFAARTADGSVEILQDAPPRGILHHHCRLGFIAWGATIDTTRFTDCRDHWPPACGGCCTVTVAPGENIQAALDSLPAAGGCVCLKVGEHQISEPLRIEKSNITLHGETLGARVVRNNAATLLLVGHPDGLLLENITVSAIHFEFENKGVRQAGLTALVAIDRCHNTKVEGCVVEAQELRSLVGIMIGRSIGIEIIDNQISRVTFAIWVVSDTTLVSVRHNALTAITANNGDGGIVGIFLMDAFGPSDIEGNYITGFFVGIALNKGLFTGMPSSLASGSAIAGNRILRLNGQTEISDAKAFAIDVAANDCAICDNYLIYGADDYGGISVSGASARVEGNSVRSLAKEVSATPSVGILVARLGPQGSLGSVGGRIVGNSILGAQDGVLLIGSTAAEVLANRIESEGSEGRFAIGLLASSRVRVHGNRITNAAFPIAANGGTANEIADNTLLRGGGGATLLNQTSLEFTQNRVEDMRNWGLIGLQGFAKFALTENRFLSCGYQQSPAIGIGVSQHAGELHVESNEVMNTGVSPDNATISKLAWGIIADYVLEARVQSNNVTYANAALLDANQEHRALWLRGSLEQVINLGAGQLVFGFSAQILDNKFLGPGRSALVEIAQQAVTDNLLRRFERVFFNNNFCWHVSVAAQPAATVSLVGRSAIVMGNHIKTNVLIPSVDFHGIKDAVYMGNIAQTGPANFGGIPTPVSGFNKP